MVYFKLSFIVIRIRFSHLQNRYKMSIFTSLYNFFHGNINFRSIKYFVFEIFRNLGNIIYYADNNQFAVCE